MNTCQTRRKSIRSLHVVPSKLYGCALITWPVFYRRSVAPFIASWHLIPAVAVDGRSFCCIELSILRNQQYWGPDNRSWQVFQFNKFRQVSGRLALTMSCYFQRSIVSLNLCKEYLIEATLILFQVKNHFRIWNALRHHTHLLRTFKIKKTSVLSSPRVSKIS